MTRPRPIAALFIRANSIYKEHPAVDCYDAERDARTWPGGCPLIAHPPCRHWGKFAYMAGKDIKKQRDARGRYMPGSSIGNRDTPRTEAEEAARLAEMNLAILAVEWVREHGGVLEHPQATRLTAVAGLPPPGGQTDFNGGMTMLIYQVEWGHPCLKPTLLYLVGGDHHLIRPTQPGKKPTHVISHLGAGPGRREPLPELSRPAREKTPPDLAAQLIAYARSVSH